MNYLGSKQIETKRLVLKAETMQEQKRLWEILMMPEVNKYFLTVPPKFKEKLLDWPKQEEYYKEKMKYANDPDIFKWSIFLKDTGECIGRITCHEAHDEDSSITDPSIRGLGWLIDPAFQRKGYAIEATFAMVDYMFSEVDIQEIRTGAATVNPASWLIMEKLGFTRQNTTKMFQYTFLDKPVEIYSYILTQEQWLSLKNNLKLVKSNKNKI